MKMDEYLKVKNMTYLEYCDYLQNKYGIGLDDYMTPAFNKKKKVSRTNDGLIAHHKKEDTMPLLSTKAIAQACPYEWQKKENIVYCDYLEHLLCHVLICQYPASSELDGAVGIGGVICYLVPELNDLYAGWQAKQAWRKNCHDKVRDDEDVYLAILKQFLDIEEHRRGCPYDREILHSSYNEKYGGWNEERNKRIYDKIDAL